MRRSPNLRCSRGRACSRALERAAAQRKSRYTAPAVLIPDFGLLPIQVAQAAGQNRASDFHYGPEVVICAASAERRDVLLVQVESLDVGAIERAMPRLAARLPGSALPCLSWSRWLLRL